MTIERRAYIAPNSGLTFDEIKRQLQSWDDFMVILPGQASPYLCALAGWSLEAPYRLSLTVTDVNVPVPYFSTVVIELSAQLLDRLFLYDPLSMVPDLQDESHPQVDQGYQVQLVDGFCKVTRNPALCDENDRTLFEADIYENYVYFSLFDGRSVENRTPVAVQGKFVGELWYLADPNSSVEDALYLRDVSYGRPFIPVHAKWVQDIPIRVHLNGIDCYLLFSDEGAGEFGVSLRKTDNNELISSDIREFWVSTLLLPPESLGTTNLDLTK